jgi:phage terminase Nu1 subunit (DNA packaging protein)
MTRESKGATNKGQVVSKSELAHFFGVSQPTIDGWMRNGCPVIERGGAGKSGKYNTADVANWLRERAREEVTGTTAADEHQLRRRKLQAETEKAELELAKAKGEVAPVQEFERATAGLMAIIRQNVLNVPARAVLQLLGETDESKFKSKLRAELVLALETAANSDVNIDDEEDEEL